MLSSIYNYNSDQLFVLLFFGVSFISVLIAFSSTIKEDKGYTFEGNLPITVNLPDLNNIVNSSLEKLSSIQITYVLKSKLLKASHSYYFKI